MSEIKSYKIQHWNGKEWVDVLSAKFDQSTLDGVVEQKKWLTEQVGIRPEAVRIIESITTVRVVHPSEY